MSDTDSNQPKGTSILNSLMNDLTFSNDAIDKISNAFSVSDETQYDFIDQDAVKRTWYQMASHDVAVTYIGGIFFTLPPQSPPRSYFPLLLTRFVPRRSLRHVRGLQDQELSLLQDPS